MRARVLNLTGAALVPLALWTLLLQYSRTFRSWDGSGLELSLHSSVQAQIHLRGSRISAAVGDRAGLRSCDDGVLDWRLLCACGTTWAG